jgi:hypothetical protein
MSTTDLTIFTDTGFSTTLKIAETLVKSGVLPRGIDNPFKAFAIIQKGREIGVGPMRALTGIALIEGKPTVSPELKLEQFRQRGGHVKWVKSDNFVAHIHLKAPNGDEHEEIVTMDDMKMAGVAGKDNWRKYPKSMLRARCVGFGLRALGEGDGSYTPDELGAVTNESGEVEYMPPADGAPPAPKEDPGPKAHAPGVGVTSPVQTSHAPATPKTATAPSASTTGTGAARGADSMSATASKKTTAADIPHEGVPRTKAQNDRIHVLREQCGGKYSGAGDESRALWQKTIGVYRNAKGERITTSADMSKNQASHLIDRMERYLSKVTTRAEQPPDLDALGGHPPDELAKLRAEIQAKQSDGDESLELDLLEVFRVGRISDLPTQLVDKALALTMAWGSTAYTTLRSRVMDTLV